MAIFKMLELYLARTLIELVHETRTVSVGHGCLHKVALWLKIEKGNEPGSFAFLAIGKQPFTGGKIGIKIAVRV